jgi:hypothetical protein
VRIVAVLGVTLINLFLSGSVNVFQDFFCKSSPCVHVARRVADLCTDVADQFPFALSIITLVMYAMMYVCHYFLWMHADSRLRDSFSADLTGKNTFIVRAPFLIPFELLLCIFWTGEVISLMRGSVLSRVF